VVVKRLPGDTALFHQFGDGDVVQPFCLEQFRQGGHDLVFGRFWHIQFPFREF
jgi:hypothetical protein